jgi:hypothetical protein
MRENVLEEPRLQEERPQEPRLQEPGVQEPSQEPEVDAGSDGDAPEGAGTNALRSDSDLEKRFPLALAMYAALAALVWFTMDAGKVQVWGRPVELRLVPLIIIGGLALRTILVRQADRIRRQGGRN